MLCLAGQASAYPQPNTFPLSWELKFDHAAPKRLVITPKGSDAPEAYWYMTFTVTNPTKDEIQFLPVFELLMDDGRIIRSDGAKVQPVILQAIRLREKNNNLVCAENLGGQLGVGDDQAKEGVIVWHEPKARMGQFTIFVKGLSGETCFLLNDKGEAAYRTRADLTAPLTYAPKPGTPVGDTPDEKKKDQEFREKFAPVVLWKTRQIRYHMIGDEKFPGHDVYDLIDEQWIMR